MSEFGKCLKRYLCGLSQNLSELSHLSSFNNVDFPSRQTNYDRWQTGLSERKTDTVDRTTRSNWSLSHWTGTTGAIWCEFRDPGLYYTLLNNYLSNVIIIKRLEIY